MFLCTVHGSFNLLKHLFLSKINVLRADTAVGKRDTDEGVQTNKGKF